MGRIVYPHLASACHSRARLQSLRSLPPEMPREILRTMRWRRQRHMRCSASNPNDTNQKCAALQKSNAAK
jgi:hypothetical protein